MERNQQKIPVTDEIPVVDLSNPNEDLVARAVVKASEEWGIFHVVNHGIPPELIRRLKEVGTEFYELPETEKEAVAKPEDSTDIEGYTTNFKGWADHLFHRIWPPSRVNYRFWPKNSPDYRYEYYNVVNIFIHLFFYNNFHFLKIISSVLFLK